MWHVPWIARSALFRGALTVCLGALLAAGSLSAANRIYVGDQQIVAGRGVQEIFVHCDNDVEVYGVSLSVAFDPVALRVLSVETFAVAAAAEWVRDAGGEQVDNLKGEFTFAFITEFDFSGPEDTVIPPGSGQPIVKLSVEVLAPAPSETLVDLVDGLGSGVVPGRNALSDGEGNTYRADSSAFPLALAGGTIRVAETPGPTPDIVEVLNNRGLSGQVMTVRGTDLSLPGTTVRVCSRPADFEAIGDDTMAVTAPDCATTGWAPLEICNGDACDSLVEGFFYEGETPFTRGDVNADGKFDISDPIGILQDQFVGIRARAPCRDSLDVNDDGRVDISDSVFLLSFLFVGGLVIPPPHPEAGTDPTPDALPEC